MASPSTIEVAPGFEPIGDAFDASLREVDRSGAALSIWADGHEVVSAWAGVADTRSGRPWSERTRTVLFSCCKGLSSIVLQRLDADGRLDLAAPIGELWPEFAVHGKGELAIADVLAHRAGVAAPADPIPLEEVLDSRRFAGRVAGLAPAWIPGAEWAYHAITFGAIAEELVRRATGQDLADVFQTEIAAPLRADVSLRCVASDLAGVARLVTTPDWDHHRSAGNDHDDYWIGRALSLGGAFPRTLVSGDQGFNDPRVLAAGVSGAGGVGTASGLARIWSATVVDTEGVRLLDDQARRALGEVRSEGRPWFDSGAPYRRWGAGVQLASEAEMWLGPASLGHDGAGGQMAFADPASRVGFAFLTNRMDVENRARPLVAALQGILK
jgi:CubicO group peptidase (beta-lactamase class C family)